MATHCQGGSVQPRVSEAKHCPTPTKPGTPSKQPRAPGAVTMGESQTPNQAIPTPQMSLHPPMAAASLLWLSVLIDPSLSSSHLSHQRCHPGHCLGVHSYTGLLVCRTIHPFQAVGNFPNTPLGPRHYMHVKAPHRGSLPAAMGNPERGKTHSFEVEEFAKPLENTTTQQFFFYPKSLPFQTFAWKAGCRQVSEPAPAATLPKLRNCEGSPGSPRLLTSRGMDPLTSGGMDPLTSRGMIPRSPPARTWVPVPLPCEHRAAPVLEGIPSGKPLTTNGHMLEMRPEIPTGVTDPRCSVISTL